MKFENSLKIFAVYICCFFFLCAGKGDKAYGQIEKERKQVVSEYQTIDSADSLFKQGQQFQNIGDLKMAQSSFEKSLFVYQSLGRDKKVGDCLSFIGIIHYYRGEYVLAISYYKKSIEAYRKVEYKEGIASVLNNIGSVYYYLGDYAKTLELFKQTVTIQEEIGDLRVIIATTQNIGVIYENLKDNKSAMGYFQKALTISEKLNDKEEIAGVLNLIGSNYGRQAEYSKAFLYLNQASAIADSINKKQLKTEILSSFGEAYYRQGDYYNSLINYTTCLNYAVETDAKSIISRTQISIGNIFHKQGDHRNAIVKCKAGLDIAKQMKAISVERDACECLYNAYKSLKNTSLALSYYEKANMLKDSLQSEETSNRLMNMEVEKQQAADSVAYVQKATIIQQKHEEDIRQREKQRNIIIISLVLALIVAAGALGVLNFVRKSRAALRVEKDRSEALLLNILPEEIAEELKEKGSVGAKNYELVSILFSDFIGFTQISEQMSPESLVEEINECFKAFDLIAEKHQVEKIKTIGDAYMAAGGMPIPDDNSYRNVVLAGLDMQQFMLQRASDRTQLQLPSFNMRLGIHVGPIVAGIVGIKKFQYDLWGDTVNTASRIESSGMVGKVNISESLYQLIKDEPCFTFESRGSINAKGKGDIEMYFVEKSDAILV